MRIVGRDLPQPTVRRSGQNTLLLYSWLQAMAATPVVTLRGKGRRKKLALLPDSLAAFLSTPLSAFCTRSAWATSTSIPDACPAEFSLSRLGGGVGKYFDGERSPASS